MNTPATIADYLQTYGAVAVETVTAYEIPLPPGCHPHGRLVVDHSTEYHWFRVSCSLGSVIHTGRTFAAADAGRLDKEIREAIAALTIPPPAATPAEPSRAPWLGGPPNATATACHRCRGSGLDHYSPTGECLLCRGTGIAQERRDLGKPN